MTPFPQGAVTLSRSSSRRAATLRAAVVAAVTAAGLAIPATPALASATPAAPEPVASAVGLADMRSSTGALLSALLYLVRPEDGGEAAADGSAEAQAAAPSGEEAPRPPKPTVFARGGAHDLVLPGRVTAVGYHESGHPRAFPLDPRGRPVHNLNVAKVRLPEASNGPEYVVMASRGRRAGGTTAVDIAMPPNEPVLSPVTGRVANVSTYALYGRVPDVIVDLVPEGRPELLVRMYHVDRVVVGPGAPVVAGETVLARGARGLPFGSQIDRLAGPGPHVHMEVHDLR